jgi:hypothetical protein
MSDATLARMEHGKYVGMREESRRDGVCTLRKRTLYTLKYSIVLVVVIESTERHSGKSEK